MNEKIPNNLFRGDSDSKGIRKLRETLHFGQLQTNLINGGNGREIFEEPILNLIDKHIAVGWRHTHFLSFSASKKMVYHYGLNDSKFEIEDPEYKCDISFDEDYTFALLTLHTEKVRWTEIESGVFEGLYDSNLVEFTRIGPTYRILLFDVCTILSLHNNDKLGRAAENARRDQEWLILPSMNKQFNFGKLEYSAILDASCITYEKIKWNSL